MLLNIALLDIIDNLKDKEVFNIFKGYTKWLG